MSQLKFHRFKRKKNQVRSSSTIILLVSQTFFIKISKDILLQYVKFLINLTTPPPTPLINKVFYTFCIEIYYREDGYIEKITDANEIINYLKNNF